MPERPNAMITTPRSFQSFGRREPDPRRRLSPAMKRFMARYIFYLEMIGYALVSLVALAIVACFFFQVNDTIGSVGDPVPIQPRMESVKPDAEALVTQLFVQNHQSVRRGDPLVEVVERPQWISRYLVMHQMQALLDAFDAPGQSAPPSGASPGPTPASADASAPSADAASSNPDSDAAPATARPLPKVTPAPEETPLHHLLKQRLSDWTKEMTKAPRIVIRAPIDGTAIVPDNLAFKQVNAGDELLKVADLNDLRLDVKLAGDTVADAREGQKAIIKAIAPDYKSGTAFRGDTVPHGRYFWQKERVTAFDLLDPKIKKLVKDGFKGRLVTERDDLPFKVTKISDVEIDADLTSSLIRSSDHHGVRSSVVQADAPADLELTGTVLKGKHALNVQVPNIPPAVRKKVAALVARQLRGKVIDAPQQPKEDGGPSAEDRLRIEAVRNVTIIARIKGENTATKGSTGRLKQEAIRHALLGHTYEKQSDARQFQATVQITNPPPFLKDRVLQMLDEGKQVKAKVDLITGRRPVAFLLLKR